MYIYILIYKLLYIHITAINAKRGHKFEDSNKGYMERFGEIKGKEKLCNCIKHRTYKKYNNIKQ